MKIFTIGFTKKSAKEFFTKLTEAGVKSIVDVRLNNVSQLAGFAKREDLKYFASEICGINYIHLPELTPTKDILDPYKKYDGDWITYKDKYLNLIKNRRIEDVLSRNIIDGGCLLCSEQNPHYCHRRLAAEYLDKKWGGIDIVHIQ